MTSPHGPVDPAQDPKIRALRPTYLANRAADVEKLAAALAAADWETAGRIGHSVKGTAASYGFDALEPLARAIEGTANARDAAGLEAAVAAFVAELERQAPEA